MCGAIPINGFFETNESCFWGNSIFGTRRAARRRRQLCAGEKASTTSDLSL